MSDAPRNYVAIPVPGPKVAAIICAAIAALLLLTLIPLAATTMKVPNGNCGTIFASSETWKYDSFADAANESAKRRVRSPRDLDNFADALIDNMMADLALGSAVGDQCKEKHGTRLIWISVVGTGAVLSGLLAYYFFRRHRQSPPPPTA